LKMMSKLLVAEDTAMNSSDDNCGCLRLADTRLPLALHSMSHSPSSLGGTPAWGTPGMPGGGATIFGRQVQVQVITREHVVTMPYRPCHLHFRSHPSLPVTPLISGHTLTCTCDRKLVVVERILVSVEATVFRVLRARRCKK